VVGEARGEIPCVVYFGDVELVEGGFAVDAGTGVAVPVPYAAEVGCWGDTLESGIVLAHYEEALLVL
jgi:hypothetical protein